MSTSTSSSTTHAGAIIIETAVPLLQRRRQQHPCEQNDTTVDNDNDDVNYINSSRNNTTTTSTVWGWNLYLFVIGILCGIVLLCLSLLSLVVMLQRYGDNESDNENDDAIMPVPLLLPTTTTTDNNSGNPLLVYREQIIYVTLYCLSYLWEIFFPIICGIFFCILSSNVRAKQILQTITGGRERQLQQQQQDIAADDDDDHVHNPTSVAYVMIVSLQGGFLVGCRCVGLAMEVYLGLPLSLASFIGTIMVDLLVCSLVIKCFEWSKHNIAILEKREEEQQQQEAEQCSYVAIV